MFKRPSIWVTVTSVALLACRSETMPGKCVVGRDIIVHQQDGVAAAMSTVSQRREFASVYS